MVKDYLSCIILYITQLINKELLIIIKRNYFLTSVSIMFGTLGNNNITHKYIYHKEHVQRSTVVTCFVYCSNM